jgi:hypothetical protein
MLAQGGPKPDLAGLINRSDAASPEGSYNLVLNFDDVQIA